ncbi:glycosyltransferase [Candidatus Woesearchaeota archaeon]|nr:hypothetical protein [uncultured archaeon]MBS3172813.1 glycosyltransferase [Candidatus Woesearchaeota archaeon]HIJ02229.1 glycosyltransferase [Candidatus Woesearchaeota archaeon]
MRLSACIVAWNGEGNIRECLESIKDVADEIIVVHDGPCKDKTIEICKQYTKKIFIRPYIGEAEPHRPFSFKKATGDWILWIDQDERLGDDIKKNIRKLIEADDVDAYSFIWPVKYKNKNLSKGFFSKVSKRVLFRKNAINDFRGLPNETLHVRGRTVNTDYRMIHLQQGERNTLHIFFTRTLRIVHIHAEQLAKKKITRKIFIWYFFKAFIWFFLYLGYYYVWKRAFTTQADRSISLQLALYNFFLYLYVTKIKLLKRDCLSLSTLI